MNLYSEFTKYCRFWFKIFQNVMWKNSIFLTSEARLSPNLQNWTKLLRFYNSGLSGQLSFEWPDWKSLGLNYSITRCPKKVICKLVLWIGQCCWIPALLRNPALLAMLGKGGRALKTQPFWLEPKWPRYGPIPYLPSSCVYFPTSSSLRQRP